MTKPDSLLIKLSGTFKRVTLTYFISDNDGEFKVGSLSLYNWTYRQIDLEVEKIKNSYNLDNDIKTIVEDIDGKQRS